MILTITCNPAIDKTISTKEYIEVGGKGINVSKALKRMNVSSMVTGFLGQENMDIFLNDLKKEEIAHHFVLVEGKTRTNTKRIIENELYEENEEGFFVEEKYKEKLKKYLDTYMNSTLIISGSVPRGIEDTFYQECVEIAKRNHCRVILDAKGEQLRNGVKAIPTIIKPNKEEFRKAFDIKEDQILNKAKELVDSGIELVVISLGKQGCYFVCKNGIYQSESLDVSYVSSLCAGDSLVAGLAYAFENHLSLLETIKISIAMASASISYPGVFKKKDEVLALKEKVVIHTIEEKDYENWGSISI